MRALRVRREPPFNENALATDISDGFAGFSEPNKVRKIPDFLIGGPMRAFLIAEFEVAAETTGAAFVAAAETTGAAFVAAAETTGAAFVFENNLNIEAALAEVSRPIEPAGLAALAFCVVRRRTSATSLSAVVTIEDPIRLISGVEPYTPRYPPNCTANDPAFSDIVSTSAILYSGPRFTVGRDSTWVAMP